MKSKEHISDNNMNNFEYTGLWWIPEKSDNQISGTLSFNTVEGGSLNLNGSFKKEDDFLNVNICNITIIQGVTQKGLLFTLYRCHEISSNLSLPGYLSQIFKIEFIFENCHFNNEEEIKFKDLSIHYDYFEEWLRKTGFESYIEFDKNQEFLKKINVSYAHPEQLKFKIDKFEIIVDYNIKYNLFRTNQLFDSGTS